MKPLVAALSLLLTLPLYAADEPPAVGVRSSEGAGFRRIDAVLPGRLLAATAPRTHDGRRALVALIAPEGQPQGPRRLVEIDRETAALRILDAEVPAGCNALEALDLDGDGADELLLAEPGRIVVLEDRGDERKKTRQLVAERGLDLRQGSGRLLHLPHLPGQQLQVTKVGELVLYAAEHGGLVEIARRPLPVEAKRERAGLTLSSPRVTPLEREGGGRLLLAGPTPVGPRRLRTAMIDPAGEAEPSEAWSLQPGPSSVEESWYVLLDRRPTLVAATLDAETIGLFEKKKLRFFPLVADRTRAGRNPSFEITTESRRWQALGAYFGDRNGDGRDDLVLIQPEGLSGSELAVDLYLGNGNGRFQPRPQRLELPASSERWHFGADFDGDGRPDFAALEDRRLSVFASATARKNKLLDPKPRWSLEPPPGLDAKAHRFAPPDTLDLDADGRPEIILTRAEDRGRGVVVVVGLR